MNDYIKERAVKHALMFIKRDETVRSVAFKTQYGKQTVYMDITSRLKDINYELYLKVKEKLAENKILGPYRGGYSTQEKWLKIKEKRSKNV